MSALYMLCVKAAITFRFDSMQIANLYFRGVTFVTITHQLKCQVACCKLKYSIPQLNTSSQL